MEATRWRIEAEAERSRVKKIVEERDIMTSNLKDLSLQYKRLSEQLKFASLRSIKKAKGLIKDELEIVALEKEVKRLNIHFRGKEEKCKSATLQLRNKTLEAVTLKVELREERDRNLEFEESPQKNYSRVESNVHGTKASLRCKKKEL